MDVMSSHLALISAAIKAGRHAVVLMDGASWHQEHLSDGYDNLSIIHIPPYSPELKHQKQTVDEFDNVTIIKLPPYSPELNPIEQVWQWLRQNELANRCFQGYEDIVEQCSRAWNNFIGDIERVKSLCTRDWTKLVD